MMILLYACEGFITNSPMSIDPIDALSRIASVFIGIAIYAGILLRMPK